MEHRARADALQGEGRYAEALPHYRAALAARPDDAAAASNLGCALLSLGDVEGACACFRAALRQAPDYADAWSNFGNALATSGAFEEAIAAYIEALRLRPAFADAWSNLGATLRDAGRPEQAVAACRNALALAPEMAGAHYNLALALLTLGDYAAGWAEHEWRSRMGTIPARGFTVPQWRGEDCAGRRVLLHGEQGLGDMLHFVRYAPMLAARGAEVVLEVPAPLLRLLARMEGVAAVVAAGGPLPAFDLHCPMMSLPLGFGTAVETIPAGAPYLRAEHPCAEHPGAEPGPRARGAGLRVGLVWAGGARPGEPRAFHADRRRSIPLAALAPLAAIQGVQLVSLQAGPPVAEAVGVSWVEDAMAGVRDFADTAAIVAGLDLVIAVDTAVAHLAGGLGRPVWLLSRFDACWRWLERREDSPWYPTMRIFRQGRPGDWADVIARVAAALQQRSATPRCPVTTATCGDDNARHDCGDLSRLDARDRGAGPAGAAGVGQPGCDPRDARRQSAEPGRDDPSGL